MPILGHPAVGEPMRVAPAHLRTECSSSLCETVLAFVDEKRVVQRTLPLRVKYSVNHTQKGMVVASREGGHIVIDRLYHGGLLMIYVAA